MSTPKITTTPSKEKTFYNLFIKFLKVFEDKSINIDEDTTIDEFQKFLIEYVESHGKPEPEEEEE